MTLGIILLVTNPIPANGQTLAGLALALTGLLAAFGGAPDRPAVTPTTKEA